MSRVFLPFICCLCFRLAAAAPPVTDSGAGDSQEQLIKEQQHFLECLSYVYSPALWISYSDALYFVALTPGQEQQLETMRSARARYISLADRQRRHEIADKGIMASGIEASWRQKLLLPYSETNLNLTPTLNKPVLLLPAYKVLQKLGNGDVMIQDGAGPVYFVMNHGRGVDDAWCTNGLFVREGERTYTTQSGGRNTVEALTSVGLSARERMILARVSSVFRREAAQQKLAVIPTQDREEFELLKGRATDSNPYMQFVVARAYLEGKGTQRDEKLGLEWMRRAGANGSGDARSYLEAHKEVK